MKKVFVCSVLALSIFMTGCTIQTTEKPNSGKDTVGITPVPKPIVVEDEVKPKPEIIEEPTPTPYYAEDEDLIDETNDPDYEESCEPEGILPGGCVVDIPPEEETQEPEVEDDMTVVLKKPVIYLYGYEGEVSVKLDERTESNLTCTYPTYNEGWVLNASKDGKLTDKSGKVYDYLFWEGKPTSSLRITEAFCVQGSKTAEFLEEKLTILGLNDSEKDDFISYWLPQMQNSPWNIISFKTDEYDEVVGLTIDPAPVNKVRVLMLWYPWISKINYTEQELKPVTIDRSKPTVVEWGGLRQGGGY